MSKKILDYGCGLGGNYQFLAKKGEYVGVDILPENIVYAKKRYGSKSFLLVDGDRLPFADSLFEEIHAYDVLEHVVNLDATLAELDRVLARGGKMFIIVPAFISEYMFVVLKPNYNQEIGHMRVVDCRALSADLSRKGYETSAIRRIRGMEAIVLSLVFWKRKQSSAVQFQTGSPQFSKLLVAFMWLFDSRLFSTPLKYFFPIYIFTLPIGWIISQIFPKSMYMVLKKS